MKCFLIIFYSLLCINVFAQDRSRAFDINERLGRGINLGNMFEAPSEGAWGNPYDAGYPKLIADKGFDHVRIPIRWETDERSMAEAPYTIADSFLARIKEVVDQCQSQGLMVIINMHHHEDLFENPEANKDRFLAQWEQIAAYFKDYSDDLIFEILNEPHGNLIPSLWNVYLNDALVEIRKSNSDRIVLIGTASYGGLQGLSDLIIPNDDNVIVSIHYYNPFPFTHQGAEWVDDADRWLGTKWYDTQSERDVMAQEFEALIKFETDNAIPVNIGEFGSYSKADRDSRLRWTTFLGRYFEQQDWSWAYWEFSAGFGIYDPDTKQFDDQLSDALLVNEMPDPTEFSVENLYTSDFTSGLDGWTLNNQGGANSSLSRENNGLKVSISNGGTAGWHVQLTKNGFELKEGESYLLTFMARSSIDKNIMDYLGMNKSPWSIYGSSNIGLTDQWEEYQLFFEMNSNDSDARIVFDLGNSLGDVELKDIVFDRVLVGTLSVGEVQEKINLYPNPVMTYLNYFNESYSNINIYDVNGRMVKALEIAMGNNELSVDFLNPGLYFVIFKGDQGNALTKIIKI